MKQIIRIFAFFLCTLLVGCAGHQKISNQLAQSLHENAPEIVLTQLSEIQPEARDMVQYQLNMGLLQLLSGQFDEAIVTLSSAKKRDSISTSDIHY